MGIILIGIAGIAILLFAANASAQEGSVNTKATQLANAIGVAEGYKVSGSIPAQANNPGDLEEGDIGYGTLGEGITVFPDAPTGLAKLVSIVSSWLAGTSSVYFQTDTFFNVGHKYVDGPNAAVSQASQDWANNVANYLGVDPNTTLGSWMNMP